MLCSYLSSHPQIKMYFELFHNYPDAIPFNLPGYRQKARNNAVVNLRNTNPVAFLLSEGWGSELLGTKAVGFKLIYTQARKSDHWAFLPPYDFRGHGADRCVDWDLAKSDLWAHL